MTKPGISIQASSRILVVDDDPETARLLRSWFKGQAYEVLEASNGKDCLKAAERESPDLILLDVRMPGMDGLTAARHLKTNPTTRSIPVILLTAARHVEDKVEGFAVGADDYITKPFAFEEVDARIRAMLRKRELYITLESTVRDLQATNKQLEELVVVDEKTGLHNYRQFRRRLEEEWIRSERYGAALSLVMLDLDDFKRINDTHGHQAGDSVLRDFATLVAGGARATDVAARYGGEEFAIILPHTSGSMAVRVAERIRRATQHFVFLEEEHPTRLTVSAGVATFPSHPDLDSPDALVEAADRALYRAKQNGKNSVVVEGPDAPTITAESRTIRRSGSRVGRPRAESG